MSEPPLDGECRCTGSTRGAPGARKMMVMMMARPRSWPRIVRIAGIAGIAGIVCIFRIVIKQQSLDGR